MLLLDAVAASKALRKNHQPGREQEKQKGNGEEGRAGERETRSGEHEEEQTTGHQVSPKICAEVDTISSSQIPFFFRCYRSKTILGFSIFFSSSLNW